MASRAQEASHAQEVPLLGLCDGHLDPNRYRTSYLTNKVGGQPDWLPGLSRKSPCCGVCGAPSVHVVQVYCPLQSSPYHRNLHLFACPGVECSGRSASWTVIRSQGLEPAGTPSPSQPAQEAPPAATDWCESADDWGMEEEVEEDGWGGEGGVRKEEQSEAAPQDQAAETAVSAQLQDLSLVEPRDDLPDLRPFFISVVEESDLGEEEVDLQHAKQLLKEYERREGKTVGDLEEEGEGGRGGGGGEEKYEKMTARHGDAVFSRFMKRISLCPQQILRYCRGGAPLFISEPPANMAQAVTACGSCGGARTFELQLMPALVSLLQRRDGGAETELEFGTVLVYTCTKSCWTDGSRSAVEEFCLVQADPDQKLFK